MNNLEFTHENIENIHSLDTEIAEDIYKITKLLG